MIDLTIPGARKLLADKVTAQIDAATVVKGKHAWRIKPSAVGKDCIAAGWYGYRWAKRADKPGRVGRIFGKGHDTEPRLMTYLRASGWHVWDVDPRKAPDDKFPQFNFKALDGHMSAYLDGIGYHPELTEGVNVLVEAKSYKKSRFTQLISKTVKAADYEYYVQICLYMQGYELPYCVFICECKDDSDIYIEIVLRDDETANRALQVGNTIKTSRVRPARVAESPAFHQCKTCDFLGVCHLGEKPETNCRSCINCVAVAGGKFACEKYGPIPNEQAILAACNEHEPIK